MKKFKFKFSAVEKVRKIEQERQIKAVALAQKKVSEIEAQIEKKKALIQGEINRIQGVGGKDALNEKLRELSIQYREELRQQIIRKKKELLEAKQIEIRERRELVERQKKKKAMEVLREKEQEKYYDESRKSELQEMDEVSSSTWAYRCRNTD